MTAVLRVRTDEDKCCSSGQCVLALPEVFDQSEGDGRVRLLLETPPAALADAVREAAYCCPAGAITVEDATA